MAVSYKVARWNKVEHISDQDLERYYLGMIREEPELSAIEEHVLLCDGCRDRAAETVARVDAIRAGTIKGRFDKSDAPIDS